MLSNLLGIRPEEREKISILMLCAFCLASCIAFFYTASNAIFLTTFEISSLPYVYIVNALLAMAFGVLYNALEKRLGFVQLQIILNGLLVVCTLIFWLVLQWNESKVVIFLLMAWFRLLLVFTGLGLWELPARIFDVRQAKRLLSLVGFGYVAAVIIGGLLTPLLTNLLGTINLLLISAGWLLIYTVVLRWAAPKLGIQSAREKTDPLPIREVFQDQYVMAIFGVKTFAMFIAFLMEYIFYQQAVENFQQQTALANFLGMFLGLNMLVTVILSAIFTGRFLSRYGVRITLSAMPFMMVITAFLAAGYGTVASLNGTFFMLVSMMMFANRVGDNAFHIPGTGVLYQPFSSHKRMAVRIVLEGWLGSLALLLNGVLLLIFSRLPFENIVPFVYLLLVTLVSFLFFIAFVERQYIHQLQQAVATRFVSGVIFPNQLPAELIEHQLQSNHPTQVMAVLPYLNEDHLPMLLNLLDHPVLDIRRDALHHIEIMRYQPAAEAVLRMANDSSLPLTVRGQAAITLIALQVPFEGDAVLKPYVLIGQRRYENPDITAALHQLAEYDPLAALEVCQQVPDPRFSDLVVKLLYSPVKQRAIQVAEKILTPSVQAVLLELLPDPQYRFSVIQALSQGGDAVVEALRFDQYPRETIILWGRIGTPKAIALLEAELNTDHPVELYQTLLLALRQARYQTERKAPIITRIQQEAAFINTVKTWLNSSELDPMLHKALLEEIENAKQRLFLLLSFIYDAEQIKAVEKYFLRTGYEHYANALEVLEVLVSREIKLSLFPLLENAPVQVESPEFIPYVLAHKNWFQRWTRLCAKYVQLLQTMSIQDELMLTIIEKVMLLRAVNIFSHTPDSVLAEIAGVLREVHFQPGQVIIEKDAMDNELFIVAAGQVRVHDGENTLSILEDGSIVGELAVLDPAPRTATVTALTDTRCFVLNQNILSEVMMSRPEVVQGIIRALVRKIRSEG